jgi:hypothetical protein
MNENEIQEVTDDDTFESIGLSIGRLVTEKNEAYGNSFEKAQGILKILYPDGIPLEKYGTVLTIARVVDKLFRIATHEKAFGENYQNLNVVDCFYEREKCSEIEYTPTWIINNEKIKVYSLSDGGTISSTRNKNMIGKCDIYIPSTCFGKDNMRIYNNFDELPGKKGYGIVFLENKSNMLEIAKNIDWSSISFLSTNSAYNLRTSLILAQFV